MAAHLPLITARATGSLRVPQLTALFWVAKLLTTGTGETLSDYLVRTFDPPIVVIVAAVVFVVCFLIQFRAKTYVAWRYWLLVTMVAVFGTMVADVAHIVVGVPYTLSSASFAVALIAVFLIWRRLEGTVSIHSITTDRREILYWLTVLTTFALGTALGDLTARTVELGYLGSTLFFAALFALAAVLFRMGLPGTAAFWAAYVMTRPLGASIADGLAVEPARGGLGLGTLPISACGLALIVIVVIALQRGPRQGVAAA